MFDFWSCWGSVPANIKLITHWTVLLDGDQDTRAQRWTCPCCGDKHLHLVMRLASLTGSMLLLAILGQVRYQSWVRGMVYYVKKGQKFACLLKPAKSGFNLGKHTKTPSWRKRYVVFSWPPFSLVASFSLKIISTALFMGLYRRLCMG